MSVCMSDKHIQYVLSSNIYSTCSKQYQTLKKIIIITKFCFFHYSESGLNIIIVYGITIKITVILVHVTNWNCKSILWGHQKSI